MVTPGSTSVALSGRYSAKSKISNTSITSYFQSISISTINNVSTYKDNIKRFSFEFPTSLVINSNSSGNNISFLQKQDDLMASRMLVQVEDYTNELEEYAGAKGYFSYGEKEDATIGGRQAMLFVKNQSMKDLCNEENDEKKRRVHVVLIKGNGYVLTFTPNDSCETYKNEWFMNIPQSVNFF